MPQKKCIKKIVMIEGMCCDKCAMRAENALSAVHNVVSADVKYKKGIGVIRSRDEVDDEEIKKTLDSVGFSVTGIEIEK